MGPPLFSLPPELLGYTGKYLPLADFISWWRTSDEVRRKLQVGLAHIKYFIPYSKEGKLAQEKTITAEQALLRTHVRRERFALAMPYSMALLAHGRSTNSMQYSDGILCYMNWTRELIAELPIYDQDTPIDDVGRILSYENGILTMSAVYSDSPILVVIDVREKVVSTTQNPSRIRQTLREYFPYLSKNIITDGRYLVCVDAPANVPEWTLRCYDLSKKDGPATVVALHEFLPRAQECRFKIFDGWFYAICANEEGEVQFQQDGEEKLYYNCCRFPIDDLAPAKTPEFWTGPQSYIPLPARLQAVQLLRGFGEEAWKHCCYHLVKDEQTGDLFIVESASSTEPPLSDNPYRRIIFPKPEDHPLNSWETRILDIVQFEQESSSLARYKHQTSPLEKKEDVREHVRPSQSIIDVTHEDLGDGSDQQVLELEQVLHLCARSTGPDARSTDPDVRSTKRDKWRFPPQSAPHELRAFLWMRGDQIIALADERSLIILTCESETHENPMRNDQLILVNFDSGVNFPDFKYLALENFSDKLSSGGGIDVTGASRSKDMRQLQLKLLQLAEEASTSSTTTPQAKAPDASKPEAPDALEPEAPDAPKPQAPVAHPWFSTEEAWYVSIKQGYRFYPPKPTAG